MTLAFTKMHGCGNDFVVVNALSAPLCDWQPSAAAATFLLDRHYGIGGDQLLILYPAAQADARMAIFNPDGSEVEMCGNGIRCCAQYLHRHGITAARALAIETRAGLIKPEIEDDLVRVDMGAPRLDAAEIPVTGQSGRVINAPPPPLADDYVLPPMTCVSMGNPHAVFFVDDVAAVPLARMGASIECHPRFPRRINVEFVQALSRRHVRMRVWERGAGITLACGTGASAAVVAGIISGRLDRHVRVTLDGGELDIAWPDDGGPVWMRGPAVEVFNGTTELPA